jgi:hypothetical protein
MKTRRISYSSLFILPGLLGIASASLIGGGCGGGGGGGGGGSTGTGGTPGGLPPMDNLISNFEDTVGTVVQAGSPPRNGYWYSYNDMAAGCTQTPANGAMYAPEVPATFPSNGSASAFALHTTFTGCATWGAGIGADLNQPSLDGGMYTGPKVRYNVSAYKGITFWAMAAAGSDNKLRMKISMFKDVKVEDGGGCVESATNKCSDDYGWVFDLPTNGTWAQVNVVFSDTTKFKQEGWGAVFAWDPTDVTSIQIQSRDAGESYDFWIDDMYFTN